MTDMNKKFTERSEKMRTFDKSTKLDNVLYDVRGPVVDEAARMEEEGKEILKLNIGNPYPFGFSAPQEVILDMLSNIRTSQGYSDSKGIFSARKAIMQYAQLRNIPNVSMNDIYTGNGVSELINLCMQALLDNGDEILIPAPDYPLWLVEKSYIISAMKSPTGIRISRISEARSQIRQKQSSSSIRITRQVQYIPKKFLNRSFRSQEKKN